MKRNDILNKRVREIDDEITLFFTYHPALTKVFEILQKEHRTTKPEYKFCTGSNPARGVSEIHSVEDL